ncbi:MAG TPA: NUDIX hydrolase [Candidatus Binataceae bacterium]|nr:NUDIX hydrolase [Candidatus Binataceae bacterium]
MARARSKSKRQGSKPKIKSRREVSAGGLIWRRLRDGAISVVLVRPAGRSTWVLPKGHLEAGETVTQAATREAREESGLTVGAIEPLGEISYVYSSRERNGPMLTRIFKRVHFFLMEHAGGDPSAHDSEIDEVAWLTFDEALAQATHPSEQALIAKARAMLGV